MNFRSTCPVSNLLDIIGDKWSILIVRDIFMGRNTYSDFLNAPEKISTNILVDRLKKLTQSGIIEYTKNPEDKKIKIYNLTSKGIDLYPMIIEMALWSKKHLNVTFSPLAIDVFNNINEIGVEKHISNTINALKK
jgi:DNA-binding HxlR family transcriptional regulator